MPHTVRVRASFGRHLLASGDHDLRRRVEVLRDVPFPPGSRSIAADDELPELKATLEGKRAFVYGSLDSAIVYTYNSRSAVLEIEFGVTEGRIVGQAK